MGEFLLLLGGNTDLPPDGSGDPDPPTDSLASDPDARLYVPPAVPPYNAPVPLVTPTYDGSGQAIHPKVLDFGVMKWHGWRYWMAYTPFPGNNDRYENPCIAVSQNGYYWQLPTGAPNPLYPAPPAPGFGSDTHLEYDPDTDQLVVLFRETLDRVHHTLRVARSSDGVHWPSTSTALVVPYVDSDTQTISPAIVRVSSGDWRLFGLAYASKSLTMWTAPNAEGPWAGPFECVGIGVSGPTWNWHLEVEYIDGVFRTLVDRGPVHEGRDDGYRASSSPDGMIWSTMGSDFMDIVPVPAWDSGELYRACMLPDEAGTHYRVWYSAHTEPEVGPNVWGIGYSEIPRSAWPAPPPMPTSGTGGTAYRTLALAHGSSMMWRMGTNPLTKTAEPDASGNGRTGAWSGRYARSSPMSGESGYASRIQQGYLSRAYESWMSAAGDFTIRAIVKPDGTFGSQTIMSLYGTDGGWDFKTNSGGYLSFVHSVSGVTIAGGSIASDQTYHLAVTKSGSTVTIYRNGVQTGQGTVSGTAGTTNARLTVGGRWSGTAFEQFQTAYVEYVDFCPTALSAAQIAASSTEALT